jgi:hypothetical protein
LEEQEAVDKEMEKREKWDGENCPGERRGEFIFSGDNDP